VSKNNSLGLSVPANSVLVSDNTSNPAWASAGSAGDVLTANSGGPPTFQAAGGAGIGGTVGTVDNAIPRADGTGGSTLKASSVIVDDDGRIAIGAGTEALPSLTLGDADTGMWTDSSNTLKWSTNGQNRLILGSGGTLTSFGGVNISSGNLTFGEALVVKARSQAGDMTVFLSDYIVMVTDTSVARTVTLPQFTNTNQVFIVKDGSGGAGTNNITISATGGVLIDGAANYVINTNWGSVQFFNDGTSYFSIAKGV